jgi:sn-1 stearoyl-lipid 9-desaturase
MDVESRVDRQLDATVGPHKVSSLTILPEHDPCTGQVRWDASRSLWNSAMMLGALAALFFATPAAVAVCVLGLAITMCTGHSVGFHRRLIHRTFACPKWLERMLVYSGTLVGMQGPFWVIHSHDLRDWAQRQGDCHAYLKHGHNFCMDGFLALHCTLKLANPPAFDPGPGIADDCFYQFLQRTWMAQQMPIALVCYALGGWPWLLWGVCMRVFIGVSMHWLVGYLCHTQGPQSWLVVGGAVQAHDVPWAAIPSMGESWHNNHHAFPASARHGLYPGQSDIGFAFIKLLERFGLAWAIQTPDMLPVRPGIVPVARS